MTPTPGGVLAKQLRKREEELNRYSKDRIKIEEKGGMKMKDILTSKNQSAPRPDQTPTTPKTSERNLITQGSPAYKSRKA